MRSFAYDFLFDSQLHSSSFLAEFSSSISPQLLNSTVTMGYTSQLSVIQDECIQRGIGFAELNHYWTRKWEAVKLSFPFATRGMQMYVAESDTWNHFGKESSNTQAFYSEER